MRYIESAAVFMICLILTLPFYISSVYAQTYGLSNVVVKGDNGIDNTVTGKDDTYHFSGRACLAPGVAVNPGYVRLWGTNNNTGFPFTSCTYVGDGCSYDCSFSRAMSDYNYICPIYNFDVNLYDENGAFVDDKDVDVVCDTASPSVSLTNNNDAASATKKINISYTITDTACSVCGARCAGIKKIVFSSGSYSKTVNINKDANECSYSSIFEEQATSFSEGDISLTATAYDNLNNNGSSSIPLKIDYTAPQLVNVKITYGDGSNIDYFYKDKKVNLDVIVNITESGEINANNVIAYFSDLGIDQPKTATICGKNGNIYSCLFDDISAKFEKQTVSIFFDVTDNAGNTQSMPLLFSFVPDNYAPTVSGLRIIDYNENDIEGYIGVDAVDVFVYANFSDIGTGIDEDSIKADLSKLNDFAPLTGWRGPGSCSKTGDITTCRWPAQVHLNQSKEVSVYFNVSDLGLLNTQIPLIYQFKVDTFIPFITAIKTNHIDSNNVNWIGKGKNSIIVYVEEIGSGLDNSGVFLDIANLVPSSSFMSLQSYDQVSSRVQVNNCTDSGGGLWECYLYDFVTDRISGDYTVGTTLYSEDDVGNNVNMTLFGNISVDSSAPVFTEIWHSPSYPTAGDTITFSVNVSDALSGLSEIRINASSISTGVFPQVTYASGCSQSDDDYLCSISITNLVTDYTNGTVYFTAEDVAGNTETAEYNVTVYKLEANQTPDFFDVMKISKIPEKIDRKSASMLQMRLFLQPFISLREENSNAKILSKSASCSSPDITGTPSLLNEDSYEPYISLKLISKDYKEKTSIPINCTLNLRVISDGNIYSRAEEEDVFVDIELYNVPLGTIDSGITEEIETLDKEIKELQEDIEGLEEITLILDIVCKVVSIAGALTALLTAVKSVLYSIICALTLVSLKTLEPLWKAICPPIELTQGFIYKFIWPPGMLPIPPVPGHIFKYICLIYRCGLCDFNTWLEFGKELFGRYGLNQNYNVNYQGQYSEATFDENTVATYKFPKTASESGSRTKWTAAFHRNGIMSHMIQPGQWLYDPFRSKGYAVPCLCLPGHIFALRKERQLKCMKKSCIQNAAQAGAFTASCNKAYDERYCLYVDSAQYRLHGPFGDLIKRILMLLWQNLPGIIMALGWSYACSPSSAPIIGADIAYCAGEACSGEAWATACSAVGAALQIMDWNSIWQAATQWDMYSTLGELEGTDYCGGS